jgi:hypothetical protein
MPKEKLTRNNADWHHNPFAFQECYGEFGVGLALDLHPLSSLFIFLLATTTAKVSNRKEMRKIILTLW